MPKRTRSAQVPYERILELLTTPAASPHGALDAACAGHVGAVQDDARPPAQCVSACAAPGPRGSRVFVGIIIGKVDVQDFCGAQSGAPDLPDARVTNGAPSSLTADLGARPAVYMAARDQRGMSARQQLVEANRTLRLMRHHWT